MPFSVIARSVATKQSPGIGAMLRDCFAAAKAFAALMGWAPLEGRTPECRARRERGPACNDGSVPFSKAQSLATSIRHQEFNAINCLSIWADSSPDNSILPFRVQLNREVFLSTLTHASRSSFRCPVNRSWQIDFLHTPVFVSDESYSLGTVGGDFDPGVTTTNVDI